MKEIGRFDSELKMFVEEPKELNQNVLESIKWSVDNGRLTDDIGADIIIFEPRKEEK